MVTVSSALGYRPYLMQHFAGPDQPISRFRAIMMILPGRIEHQW